MAGRLARAAVLLFGAAIALGPAAASLRRSWHARVAVVGHSMEPTLLSGDWLLVDSEAYRQRRPQIGELVVAPDPRRPGRLIVKRVAAVNSDGGLHLRGDHPAHGVEAGLPAVPANQLLGRPWLRYWPIMRLGRLR